MSGYIIKDLDCYSLLWAELQDKYYSVNRPSSFQKFVFRHYVATENLRLCPFISVDYF